MPRYRTFQVDAFASAPFTGNPAAVMKLDAFFSDGLMQKIAQENNLSETAYVVPRADGSFDLRWFTPTVEIAFCGHATLAAAHVLAAEYDLRPPFTFHAKIGELNVTISGGKYILDAPIAPAVSVPITPAMKQAFPIALEAAFTAGDNLYVVAESAAQVRAIMPDMSAIVPLSDHGVGLTARGDGNYDCVSRFFVPAEGIDEDPVTGSAHAAIGPYWAARLGKTNLRAYQASARGGELGLRIGSTRLDISGNVITVIRGEIELLDVASRKTEAV